jgi:hypothetical protein
VREEGGEGGEGGGERGRRGSLRASTGTSCCWRGERLNPPTSLK